MKKLILVFVLALLIIACKNETKETVTKDAPIEKKAEVNPELVVVMRFKTNKSDNIKLMLNNVVVDEFQKMNIHVIEKTEPNTAFDEITARFGDKHISNNFFISLGNKEVKEVEIQSIYISYGDRILDIKAANLEDNFSLNKYIAYDKNTGKLTTSKVEGKHIPTMSLKRKAIKSLSDSQ